jgi:hypothetical protein
MTDYPEDWEVVFYRARIYEMMGNNITAGELYQEVNHLFPENEFISGWLEGLRHGN